MRSKDVVARTVSGEAVLVPIRRGVVDLQAIFVLNEVGSWIWEQIDGRRSSNQIADGVASEFEVAADEALRDLQPFLQALAAQGLLEPSS